RGKLPFNIARKPLASSVPSAIINRTVNEKLVRELEESAARYGCHVRDLCLAAHLYLLRVVTAERDIVTGVVSHDRPAVQDGERILGCFLNSLPMRVQMDKREEKQALLHRVSDTLYRMKSHEVFLSDIARMIGERSDPALNPIFDILFNYTDFHVLDFASAGDVIRPEEAAGLEMESAEMTNTLLDVEVHRSGHRMNIQIKYAPQYFYDQDMETVFSLYMRILERLSDPDIGYLDSADLMLEEEKAKLLHEWNAPVHELPEAYTEGLTLHALFEEQAVRTPDAPAVRHRGRTLTYAQLEADANRLARHLADRGVHNGDHVALVADRGCAMITGMLAILKAGAAYVPIDPDYPAGRKAYILQNAEATAVLSDQAYPDLEDFGRERLIHMSEAELTGVSSEPLKLEKDSRDLAYIIYTSGSTGTPKGVMIEHRSAVNLVSWVNTRFEVGTHDRLLFITSMCFDLSVYDIFGMLAAGGTVVVAEREEVLEPASLLKLMNDEGVTFWDSVPTTMNHFMHQVEEMLSDKPDMRLPAGLRLVFMSGDWIPVTLPDRIRLRFPQAEVISLGGATEGTVWSNYYPIGDVSSFQSSIPYGVPIGGNAFYILDEDKEPVPWGVAGELYIGGVGVARGYRNDEAKTNAAFVSDPFLAGSMMYKTGDLGRLLPDGNMEFLGRKDHQVKIRGYRVELGEIDGRLSRHPGIREAVTIDRQDGREHRYLCAYIVPSDDTLTQAEIREYLAAELPSYMVPAAYVWMDRLPLNANGKVDRGQLPEPDGLQETADSFTAPQTPTERKLAAIWRDILKIDRVGAQEHFFEIGGDSLNAASMAGRIQKELGAAVPLQDIFRLPKLEKLASFIDSLAPQTYTAIPVIPEQEWYQVSPAQEWIYILSQKDGDGDVYNMPSVLEITGEIDPDRIRAVFLKLIDRHETLRTGFEIRDQEVVQRVYSEVSFEFEWIPWRPYKNEMLEAFHDFIRPFGLSKPPLLRVGLAAKSREEHLMIVDMHHIISDGVSLQIIMNDFLRLYAGEELAPLAVQYKDYAAWQRKRMESELNKEREAYWNQALSGELPRNELPIAYPRPAVRSFEGALHAFEIEAPVVEELRRLAVSTGSTMYMVLLAAYSVLLSQYSDSEEDIVLGTQVAGRTSPELAPMIGMFVNTLPLRNYPRKELTFRAFLSEVRTNTLHALENQDYPFAAIVEKLGMKHESGRNPVFDYVFAFAETEHGHADIGEISVRPYPMDHHVAKFDMTLTMELEQSRLTGAIEYSTALFSTKAIEGLTGNFTELVRRIAEDPERLLASLQPASSDKPASSLDNLELMF
uniref:non-ribosomal peptide synthetase n=1 Tax=Paenibacillus kobensis TaxID=59841 RepID=UPI000FD7A915